MLPLSLLQITGFAKRSKGRGQVGTLIPAPAGISGNLGRDSRHEIPACAGMSDVRLRLNANVSALGPHPERRRRIKGRASQKPASPFDFAQDEASMFEVLDARHPRQPQAV